MKTQALKSAMRRVLFAVAFCAAALSSFAENWTVSENTTLTADTTVDALTVEDAVTLDLAGYSLTCSSLAGSGTITSLSGTTDLTSPDTDGTHVTWSTNGGTAQNASGDGTNLFNNTTWTSKDVHNNAKRIMVTKANLPLAVTYDFGEGTTERVNKYNIYFGSVDYDAYNNRGPKDWVFEGSNGNDVWTKLDTQTGITWENRSSPKSFSFENATPYRYYRITFTASRDASYLELNMLEYFNTNPGELHVNVPADVATANTSVTISGNVKVVKEGAGTFTATKSGQSYTGGTEVIEGTLKAGAGNTTILGPKPSNVKVSTGGVFDVNGQTRMGDYCNFILDGGTVRNDASGLNDNNGRLSAVSLTADSTFDFANAYGFYSPDGVANVNLAGHTLTMCGTANKGIAHVDVTSEGTIDIEEGLLHIQGSKGTSNLKNATLVTGATGQFCIDSHDADFELGSYICNTIATDSNHYNEKYRKAPKLYGTFKPNTDYFHGVELQDGATIDLSGRTTALPLRGKQYPSVSASLTSLHTVTFATPVEPAGSITIYVKLGDSNPAGKIISWDSDSIPSNVTFSPALGENREFVVRDNGLAIKSGLTVVFW